MNGISTMQPMNAGKCGANKSTLKWWLRGYESNAE